MEMNNSHHKAAAVHSQNWQAFGFLFVLITILFTAGFASGAEDASVTGWIETVNASGVALTGEDVVLNGKTGGIKSLCVFDNAEGRILIPTAGKRGYTYIYSGDGARTMDWKITSGTGSLCALVRIGTTHHAAVKVTARKQTWSDERPDEEVILWINAYSSTKPAIVPADTQRTITGHGEIVSFDTGIPNAAVELTILGVGIVTTAESDETGLVVFDSEHSADGQDHYVSLIYTYGRYDYHAATAYASDPANLLAAAGGTGFEWVSSNDCATFQSRVLTAGGFPVYAPYANSSSNPGGSLTHTLISLIGEDHLLKKDFTVQDFHEGDIVWGHDMGHAMYCAQVDPENDRIFVYAHSTSLSSTTLTDMGWVSIGDLDAVAKMVEEEVFNYEYRINGISNPRRILFVSGLDGKTETIIAEQGSTLVLPECSYTAEGMVFAGWVLGDTLYQPGEECAVDGHMTFTASWSEGTDQPEDADIILPAFIQTIDAYAFEGINAVSVFIPDGCESIGAMAFGNCPDLRRIRIPDGCIIDDTAFDGCASVTIYGMPGGAAQDYCDRHHGFQFMPESEWPYGE